MKKIKKILFISGAVLAPATLMAQLTSCGHKKSKSSFSDFISAADKDGKATLTANSMTGDYWGSAATGDDWAKAVSAKMAQYISQDNIDKQGKFIKGFNGAFETKFNLDDKNTIAVVDLKVDAGASIGDLTKDTTIKFNSWDNYSYKRSNWATQDNSDNYAPNKFFSNIKTDQTKLISAFGSHDTSAAPPPDSTDLQYKGITKFSDIKETAVSSLVLSSGNNLNVGADMSIPKIQTTYTMTMTGQDSSMKVANVTAMFTAKKDWTPITTANITIKSFSSFSATSALSSDQIKKEITDLVNTGKNMENWETGFKYKEGHPISKLTIDSIDSKGVLSLTIITSSSDPKTETIKSVPLIAKGFQSLSNNQQFFIRFNDANFNFKGDNFSEVNIGGSMQKVLGI